MGIRAVHFAIVAFVVLASCSFFTSVDADLHENKRPARDAFIIKTAVADTDAKSDSEAGHGMASSSSSTKGSAAFITKHPGKYRRSVEVAVADTDAESDSKADHGIASSSSSTKGSAAFVSKHLDDKHPRPARSVEAVKISLADTEAKSDSKAKDGMALSSSSTKGNAAFVSKNPHRRSVRAVENVELAVANTEGESDSAVEFPHDESEKKHPEEAKPDNRKEEHPVASKEETEKDLVEEEPSKEKKEESQRKPFFDLDSIKKKISKLAAVAANL